jgi:hypothetical protein
MPTKADHNRTHRFTLHSQRPHIRIFAGWRNEEYIATPLDLRNR